MVVREIKMNNDANVATTSTQTPPANDAVFNKIAEKIIEKQETIIGPVAVEQAKRVKGLTVNWPEHSVAIKGSPQTAIDDLIERYKELFGQIAVQASREAVASITTQLPANQLPRSLQ